MVANAGICPLGPDRPVSVFGAVVQVNFGGVVNTVEAALPHLGAGASIILTGSVAGMRDGLSGSEAAGPGGIAYAMAKKQVAEYGTVLARALAPSMIRVNVVHPTNVDTPMLHSAPMYGVFRPDLDEPTRGDVEGAFATLQAMPVL